MQTSKKNQCLECPVQKTAELLSDVWTILIIRDLMKGHKRFTELEKLLDGISTRTLTLKLKKLIEENLVEKKETSYSLTKKGKGLNTIFEAMNKYGKKYI